MSLQHPLKGEMILKKTAMWATSLLVVLSMAACGSNNGNNASSTNASGTKASGTNASTASGQAAGKEQIKFYTFKANNPDEPTYKAVQAYNESQDKVEVEYVSLVQNSNSTDFVKKLDIMIGSGEVIDVFMTGNEDEVLERASRGVVEPLNAYFDKENVKPEDEYTKLVKFDNQIYGLLTSSTQWLTVFNREHLDKAGLKLPEMGWTWHDFRDYAKKLTVDGHYGTYFHTWGEYANVIAYTERPNPQLDADLNPIFDDPSFKYFFELRREMEEKDKSVEPYADVLASNYHVLQQFFAGNASMLAVPSYVVRAGLNLQKFPHDFQMVYAPIPRSVDSQEVGMTNISGAPLAIGAKSKHKEAAYDFVRWMSKESSKYTNEVPAYKGADGAAMIKDFYKDNEDLIDTESLTKTLFDPRIKVPNAFSVPYGSELKTIVENGFSSYMLNHLDFDEVKTTMTNEVKKVVDANK